MTEERDVGIVPGPGRLLPRLHVVTDDAILARRGWISTAIDVMDAGGARVALHVRGPETDGATIFDLAATLAREAKRNDAAVIVNDRVDVAMAAAAHGVHLGRRSLSVPQARALVGEGSWIGASTHAPATVGRVRGEGADYAFVGTLYETPSHRGLPGMGVDGLSEAIRFAGALPVLGIGGIDVGRVGGVLAAGAHGVAVMRGIWHRPDVGTAVAEYLTMIEASDR